MADYGSTKRRAPQLLSPIPLPPPRLSTGSAANAALHGSSSSSSAKNTVQPNRRVQTLKILPIIITFIVAGTCSTIASKILYQMKGSTRDGEQHHFRRPLLQNAGMFLGMSSLMIVFYAQKALKRFREVSRGARIHPRPSISKKKGSPSLLPMTTAHGPSIIESEMASDWHIAYLVSVPAFCDFLATYAMNVALLWINVSVWQMVRGSEVLFSALIRWQWLKKPLEVFHWIGCGLVMVAMVIIGVACVQGEPVQERDAAEDASTSVAYSPMLRLLGIMLVFLAQFVQALQGVIEEHLLQDIKASDMQVVGLEGMWGLVLCIGVGMPFAYYTNIMGMHEDTGESLYMLDHSWPLMAVFAAYVIVIAAYNMFAMKVTMIIDSVTRNVLDSSRTFFIWVTVTVLHYGVSRSIGEAWTFWSWFQLAGFGVLVLGIFVFYEVVHVPGLSYPYEVLSGKQSRRNSSTLLTLSPARSPHR